MSRLPNKKITTTIPGVKFWHKMPLNDGTFTDGDKDVLDSCQDHLWSSLNLKGSTVLDAGCWDGGFSFLAEKAGATRVVSMDRADTRGGIPGTSGYHFLHSHYASKCEYLDHNIYTCHEVLREREFDVVLGYGILYHMSDPLLSLRNLFRVCDKQIVFEGVWYRSQTPLLHFKLSKNIRGAKSDKSFVYAPSIGFMKDVAAIYGFKLAGTHYGARQQSDNKYIRGSLLFERVSSAEQVTIPDRVFPV